MHNWDVKLRKDLHFNKELAITLTVSSLISIKQRMKWGKRLATPVLNPHKLSHHVPFPQVTITILQRVPG